MNHSGAASILYLDQDQSLLGRREVYCCGYNESQSAYWPHTAFFCPSCGDLWARAIFSFNFEYRPIPQEAWKVTARRCVKCGDGTLLDDQLDNADSELITREFLALLERYHYE